MTAQYPELLGVLFERKDEVGAKHRFPEIVEPDVSVRVRGLHQVPVLAFGRPDAQLAEVAVVEHILRWRRVDQHFVARKSFAGFFCKHGADFQLFLFAASVAGVVGEPDRIDLHRWFVIRPDGHGAFVDATLQNCIEQLCRWQAKPANRPFKLEKHPVVRVEIEKFAQGFRWQGAFVGDVLQQPPEHGRKGAARVVPVNVAHHHVLGEQQAFERRDPFFGDREALAFRVGHERFDEPLDVDAAVRNVAVVRVTHEVVHLVGIERAAHQFAEPVSCFSGDDFGHGVGIDLPVVVQDGRDGGDVAMILVQELAGQRFVVREHGGIVVCRGDLFKYMRMGIVSDVVQQTGGQQRAAGFVVELQSFILQFKRQRIAHHALQNHLHQVINADRVFEARVVRAGIDLLRERKLPDAFEPQERRVGENFFERRAQRDVAPDGNADKPAFGAEKKRLGDHDGGDG